MSVSSVLSACLSLAFPIALSAQTRHSIAPALGISTSPAPLGEGTLGWLLVRVPRGTRLAGGLVTGEPLHFTSTEKGHLRALVPIPVETADSIPVSLFLEHADQSDTVLVHLAVRRANYRNETLTVPPAYARPDSATAERIQSEIALSREISRLSQERPRLWRGPFLLPRPARITSGFGTARLYNGEVQSRHLGTDFAGAIGVPVRAAGRGVVVLVADFYLAGRAVYIDHGAGLVTGYFHLSRVDVRKGQTVVTGQRIGAVGRTGRVTGPHLHWVARYGGISVDPMSLLELVKSEK